MERLINIQYIQYTYNNSIVFMERLLNIQYIQFT